jgi:glucokinase
MIELSGGPEITAKGLMLAAGEGDQPATEILKETARWLARGIVTVIRILNPEVIVLGGGVAQSGELLLKTLRGSLDEFSSPTITYSTEIVTAALGTYSALYGAAAMGMDVG